MGQTEVKIFIVLVGIVILIFIVGIIMFVFQYRKRKLLHYEEKLAIEKQHKFDLMNTQLETQRQAMQHIGQEIHDSVGQKLTLASLYAKRLAHGDQLNELEGKAAEIGKIIDASLAELRQLSKTLTNPQFASIDIITLLKEEEAHVNATGVCRLSIETNEPKMGISLTGKNILLGLLQEFIQNSLKYAGCEQILICFKKEGPDIFITASDNGKGFDMNVRSNGIGLQNMKKRAEQLNAEYVITSEPGKGTSVFLHFKNNRDQT